MGDDALGDMRQFSDLGPRDWDFPSYKGRIWVLGHWRGGELELRSLEAAQMFIGLHPRESNMKLGIYMEQLF